MRTKSFLQIVFYFSSIFLFCSTVISQDPDNGPGAGKLNIDSVINLVTTNSVGTFLREISGDMDAQIGGSGYKVETRYANTNSNKKARQYIYEKMLSFGLNVAYDNYSGNGANIIGRKTGVKYPNQYYIICCHFDDMPSFPENAIAPGADDNGSGVVGVLESARLLSNAELDYTVMFIAFDEEEIDILGSEAYALNAYNRGDSILGVINMDMIAYDSNNDGKFEVLSDSRSNTFASEYVTAVQTYTRNLIPLKSIITKGESDQISFWKRQWKGFHIFEDDADRNPNMHSADDKYSNCNINYMRDIVKSVIAFVITKSKE